MSGEELVGPARFLAGPPVSEDDLETLVGEGVGKKMTAKAAARVATVLRAAWDPVRFPWITQNRAPTPNELQAATEWTAGLWAVERTRTEMRNEASKKQQAVIADALVSYGYTEIPRPKRRHIESLDNVARGEFTRNALLAGKDCDVAVRLNDGRLLAIECKVSNSSVNSIKRLINDAGGKADIWAKNFGAQVVTAAVLAGVFELVNLVDVQKTHGVFLVWEHDLAPLKKFLDDTTPK